MSIGKSQKCDPNAISWLIVIDQVVDYDEEIDGKAYFDKVIRIWSEYPGTVTSRVTTAVKVDADSNTALQVLSALGHKTAMDDHGFENLEIRKYIRGTGQRCKDFSENAFEVSYYEEDLLVRFFPVVLDGDEHPFFSSPYTIGCRISSEKSLKIELFKPNDAPDEHFAYFKSVAFPKIVHWFKNVDLSKETIKTMSLIDKENYLKTYRSIREENSRNLIENWTERSNAEKSVFEDCGITAYILEIFNMDILPKPKKYVDMGCGNGLLVHLLQKNGISGYGIDVRARKIWSTTFKDSDLRVGAVDPQIVVNNEPHFDKDVDLLIGNHSDELTPWIPVMAAKLRCNFFVIPCCPFDFFGKYNNTGSHKGIKRFVSQYESFFEWTASIAERLGFEVLIDRLAIPSTKRLCIIGRVPEGGLHVDVDQIIENFTVGKKFVARSSQIVNRNCTNISIPDRERIAKMIFHYILNKSDETVDGWRCGGVVGLAELAGLLNEQDRKLMKDQCGGLQTFLRNNFQIFQVYGGEARLRDLRQPRASKTTTNQKRGNRGPPTGPKPCWMAANHPDGCPVGSEKCRFAH